MNEREKIARRVAQELRDSMVVNLVIGMPTMVADYVPEDIEIMLQPENGILGMEPLFQRFARFCAQATNANYNAVCLRFRAAFALSCALPLPHQKKEPSGRSLAALFSWAQQRLQGSFSHFYVGLRELRCAAARGSQGKCGVIAGPAPRSRPLDRIFVKMFRFFARHFACFPRHNWDFLRRVSAYRGLFRFDKNLGNGHLICCHFHFPRSLG